MLIGFLKYEKVVFQIEKYVFLLGGHDLEMLEIRNILDKQNMKYYDNQLAWGAKLSDYKDEIKDLKDDYYTIVGIELNKDIELKNNKYIEIDHHNENNNKKAPIEQIADILGLELNRYQKLVAENDKGYIKAMKKYGASKEEIDRIRRKDREAQGISKEDEILAEESLKFNKKNFGNLIVVKSKTSKFSTITDRLYPAIKILIYTDDELTYYGDKAIKLGKMYQEKYDKDKVYYGGDDQGYFGFSKGVLGEKELKDKVKEIIEYVK